VIWYPTPRTVANQRAVEAKIDLAPQIIDIDIHDIGHRVEIQPPNLFRRSRIVTQPVPRCIIRNSSSANSLGLRSIRNVPARLYGVREGGRALDRQFAALPDRGRAPSSKYRADSGGKFGKKQNGLRHIVICTCVEPANSFFQLIGAGEQTSRECRAFFSRMPRKHVQARRAVQIQIEQHHIKRLLRCQPQRFSAR